MLGYAVVTVAYIAGVSSATACVELKPSASRRRRSPSLSSEPTSCSYVIVLPTPIPAFSNIVTEMAGFLSVPALLA